MFRSRTTHHADLNQSVGSYEGLMADSIPPSDVQVSPDLRRLQLVMNPDVNPDDLNPMDFVVDKEPISSISKHELEEAIKVGDTALVAKVPRDMLDHCLGSDDKTPLIHACELGKTRVVRALLAQGARPNHTVANQDPPLVAAIKAGSLDVVEALVANRADVKKKNRNGCTPLMIAAKHNHPDILPVLLLYGACANKEDKRMFTALHYVSDSGGDVTSVHHLIENGAIVDPKDAEGITPLMLASYKGHLRLVNALLALGACYLQTDHLGKSALCHATLSLQYEVAASLLRNCADVDHRDASGYTALMRACARGNLHYASLLLGYRASLHCEDHIGRTAIDHATREARALLERQGVARKKCPKCKHPIEAPPKINFDADSGSMAMCCVCLNKSDMSVNPVMLACQHSLCTSCYERLPS